MSLDMDPDQFTGAFLFIGSVIALVVACAVVVWRSGR